MKIKSGYCEDVNTLSLCATPGSHVMDILYINHRKNRTFHSNFAKAMEIFFVIAGTVAASSAALADPLSPAGWTSNLQLGAPLPEGVYFVDTAYYLNRSGPTLAPGLKEVEAAVNIPVLAWSTPVTLLGGRLEVVGFAAELAVGINPGATDGTSSSHRDFYNPAGLVGLAWDLGGGWSFSDFVGGFAPVDTDIGKNLGLGGNFWTFADLAGIAYNQDGWSLSANFIYLHSGHDLSVGGGVQPDTVDVDFAAIKHIDKWEAGLIGSASADVTNALRNGFGTSRSSQVSLGGLVGYSFGPVTTELLATRSVEARNQVAGGYDTRVWGRIIISLWNPSPPATVVARY